MMEYKCKKVIEEQFSTANKNGFQSTDKGIEYSAKT